VLQQLFFRVEIPFISHNDPSILSLIQTALVKGYVECTLAALLCRVGSVPQMDYIRLKARSTTDVVCGVELCSAVDSTASGANTEGISQVICGIALVSISCGSSI